MVERAVTIEAIEGVLLEEYVTEVCKEVKCKPENIDSISVIPCNKICIYFSSSYIANKCRTKVLFKERLSGVKPKSLWTPDIKIIISNVFPMIPNECIKQALKNCGIRVTSDIQTLPAGFTKTEFAEIKSFKRQVFIRSESRALLPETMELEYMSVKHNIFFSAESEKCFLCYGVGSRIKANINIKKRKSDSTPSTVRPSTSKKSLNINSVSIKPSVSTEERNLDSTLQPKLDSKTNLSSNANTYSYNSQTQLSIQRSIEQHNSTFTVSSKLNALMTVLSRAMYAEGRQFDDVKELKEYIKKRMERNGNIANVN